jgi:glutamate--cysteine ligase
VQVSDVIIQEGVPTVERVDEGTAEPVVYMMDRYVVGGFYRVNASRGTDENLNAPGMHFQAVGVCHRHARCRMLRMAPGCAREPVLCLWCGGTAGACLAASLELERAAPVEVA